MTKKLIWMRHVRIHVPSICLKHNLRANAVCLPAQSLPDPNHGAWDKLGAPEILEQRVRISQATISMDTTSLNFGSCLLHLYAMPCSTITTLLHYLQKHANTHCMHLSVLAFLLWQRVWLIWLDRDGTYATGSHHRFTHVALEIPVRHCPILIHTVQVGFIIPNEPWTYQSYYY